MRVFVVDHIDQVYQRAKPLFDAFPHAPTHEKTRLFFKLMCIMYESVHVLVRYDRCTMYIQEKYNTIRSSLNLHQPVWFVDAVYDMFAAICHLSKGNPRPLHSLLDQDTTFFQTLGQTYRYLRNVAQGKNIPRVRPVDFHRTDVFMYHFVLHQHARYERPLEAPLSPLTRDLLSG